GHSGEISALVLSPDDQTFITSGSDRTAKIWSFATGELLQTLKTGSHCGLKGLALTPSSLPLTLFTAGEEIGVWDGRSCRKVRSLKGEQQSYYSVAISADGQYLASGSFAYGIQIWDWQRGKLLLSFKHSTDSGGKYSEVTALAFSTHHRALMSLDSVGRLRFWHFLTGEQMSSPMAQHSITKMAISPDATVFAAASSQGIQIWDLVTDTKIHTLPPYRDRRNSSVGVRCLAFSPNNRLLASGYYRTPTSAIDNNIKIWDIASGQEQQSLPGHSLTVTGLAFSRNGQTLISCSEDSSVRIWQTINA
ncbi:MAG TPA: WD40 repeat domain-containing protein, partial [Coleofasciculaceae cyanobacterium]